MNQETTPTKNSLTVGGTLASINPQSFEDVQRIAIMAVKAGLYPKAKARKGDEEEDHDTAVAKATMAIMQGMECGIPAMQAVQNIAIINGRAMMYGDLLTALLWSRGFKVKKWTEGDGTEMKAFARIVRPDGEVIEKTYSVAQAKQAKLWDERPTVKKKWGDKWEDKPNDAPWHRFPDRMLEWRAFGFCVKDGASDATHGMMVREEAAPEFNEPAIDITPVEMPDPPEPTRKAVGRVDQHDDKAAKQAATEPAKAAEKKTADPGKETAKTTASAKKEPAKVAAADPAKEPAKPAEPDVNPDAYNVTDYPAYADEFETKIMECEGDIDAMLLVWKEHELYDDSLPIEFRTKCREIYQKAGGEFPE